MGDPHHLCKEGGYKHQQCKGGMKKHSWSSFAEMLVFDLFRMSLPENFICEVVIPMTKNYFEGPHMTLQDFYVWLGFHFFMSGFEEIDNNKMWWFGKADQHV